MPAGSNLYSWQSDGGSGYIGTKITSSFWSVTQLMSANGSLYFAGDESAHGTELWKSDGTADGTAVVGILTRVLAESITG